MAKEKKETKKTSKKDDQKLEKLEVEIEELKEEAKKAQEELVQEKEKFLRAYAEQENFKKRKEQEFETFCKYAGEKFVTEMLPVLDSFDRACEHAGEDKKNKELVAGFTLIQKQFHTVLEKLGVKPIDAVGKPFDPNFHQAVMQEESENKESNTVLKEMQKGYTLHDRILRPSMVVVAT
jgi:molecular chaperone GrpE